jgi:hypothetical protein
MIKSIKLISVCSITIALAACNGGVKPEKKEEILNSQVLNTEQLTAALNDKSFTAKILTGERAGSFNFTFDADGTLYIAKSGYSGTQQWSVKDGALCVKTCHHYHQDEETGILYGKTDNKISAILTPR